MRFFFLAVINFGVLTSSAPAFAASTSSRAFAVPQGNYFERDGNVFVSHGSGGRARIGPTGIELDSPAGNVSVTFEGARRGASAEPHDALKSVSHYMLGNRPKEWRLNVARYRSIRYSEVYDRIDLVYHHEHGLLEYDFAISAGANPTNIRMRIDGADRIEREANGDLVLYRGDTLVRQKRPAVYQESGGERRPIEGTYFVEGNSVRFITGAYDPSQPLIIDPEVSFSSYIGREDYALPLKIGVDPAGNIFVAGIVVLPPATLNLSDPKTVNVFLTKLDSKGNEIFTLYFGGNDEERLSDLTVDSLGRAYLVGETESTDFPVVRPFGPHGDRASGFTDGFVMRVSQNGAFEYSSYLGGSLDDRPLAITVDTEFHSYITGGTYSPDFPTTPGALKRDPDPAVDHHPSDAFVTKLAPDGKSLIFSTRLGGRRDRGGSSSEFGSAVAVDVFRNVYVGGLTNSLDFPLTMGALQTECFCSGRALDIFLTKLDAKAENVLYSTYFGGPGSGGLSFKRMAGISVDSSGRVHIAGTTNSPEFPATREPLGGRLEPDDPVQGFSASFLAGIDPVAGQLVYSTFVAAGAIRAFAMDPAGRAYLTGVAPSVLVPTVMNASPPDDGVFAVIAPSASDIEVAARYRGAFAGRDLTLSPTGDLYLLGDAHYVSRLAALEWQSPPLQGFANAARLRLKGRVSPGELIAIFGSGIGPDEPTGARLDSNGDVSSLLAGNEVFIGGLPAPLIFAQNDQVNAVAPLGLIPGFPAPFEIRRNGTSLATINVDVVESDPAVFRTSRLRPNTRELAYAAALNQDGTINSPDNPAPAGTIIAVFGTGFGALNGTLRDGEIRFDNLPRPQLPVTAHYNSSRSEGPELAVHYAGQAPGLVAGVMQVNIQLPPDIPLETDVPISLAVAGQFESFWLFVKP